VNWNVHVGHGDVLGLIDKISGIEEVNGFGKPEFVLLLQESFRQSEEIPASTGIKVPRRIAPPDPKMDIEDLAQKLGWWMFYAPSMRNGDGRGKDAEDRGNAILSSLPLEDVEAVELPFAVLSDVSRYLQPLWILRNNLSCVSLSLTSTLAHLCYKVGSSEDPRHETSRRNDSFPR
jgi:hypothetical protein